MQLGATLLSSFLIALREGVEAALVVGIILVYLSRTGRAALARYVWAGVISATVLSLAVALALEKWRIQQDGFEGLLMLVAAGFVVTVIVWMNRIARHLRKEIESRVESYAGRAAGWGLLLFVFFMVLREGVELALILRAVEISTEGLQTWVGTISGIAAAVAVGLFFFKGSLRVPLHRFFAVTSAILVLVAIQLGLTGLHELSEALWLPSSKAEMALIGPIVRNDLFFFVFILGAAAVLVFREWMTLGQAAAPGGAPAQPAVNDAERRRLEWERRRQRRWMMSAASACFVVLVALTAEFVYARAAAAPPTARPIEAVNGEVRIPISEVQDSNLHLFSIKVKGTSMRFLVIRKPNGWGTALDACRICGAAGYHQDGQNVICRHCASAIYIPSIGDQGGCNPIGVPYRVEGAELVLDVSALTQAWTEVPQ